MAVFTYTARDARGTSRTGQVTAESQAEATQRLRGEGIFVVQMKQQSHVTSSEQMAEYAGSQRIRQIDVIFFVNQLSLMVDSGVPIAEALEGIIKHNKPGKFRRTLNEVLKSVQAGQPFSAALAQHPRVFSSLFVNLIRAAELSGKLGDTLVRIAEYMVNQREIRNKIRAALTYPAVLCVLAFSAIIFLMTYLMPQFTSIYKGKEDLLPTLTVVVVSISDTLLGYWYIWLSCLSVIVTGLIFYRRTPQGRHVGHWLLLNIPIIGPMMRKSYLTRSLHTLGTLIDSGVTVLDGVSVTRRVAGNYYFERMWDNVLTDLQTGNQLSDPLFKSKLVPRPLAQTIEAGERSGQLGKVMRRVSVWLETDLKESINRATRLIEPLMILILGSAVGTIAAAMLLPIFSISRAIR